MRFKRRVAVYQLADLLGSLTSIVFGIVLRSYWALVFGKITTSLGLLVFSYVFVSYRPRFRFERSTAGAFLSFGKPMFVISILVYIITSVDDLVIGKVLGMSILGYYTMAYGLANYPTFQVTRTISQVAFPAYARLQQDPGKLQTGFLSIFFYTSTAVLPLCIGLALLSEEFTLVVLGGKWLPMVDALRILCFLGLFRAVASIVGPLIIGYGRPDYLRNIKLAEFIVFAPLIYPVILYGGLVGVSLFTTGIYALSLVLHLRAAGRILPGVLPHLLGISGKSAGCALIMSVAMLAEKFLLFKEVSTAGFLVMIATGAAVYLPLAWRLHRGFSTSY